MKIHEYQAKQLMAARQIAVPKGTVATDVKGAVAAVRPLIEESGNRVVVVKSQIHAGGRGKGTFKEHPELSGVNVVLDGIEGGIGAAEEKVRELAEKMLGSTLVTIQTGPEGKRSTACTSNRASTSKPRCTCQSFWTEPPVATS